MTIGNISEKLITPINAVAQKNKVIEKGDRYPINLKNSMIVMLMMIDITS